MTYTTKQKMYDWILKLTSTLCIDLTLGDCGLDGDDSAWWKEVPSSSSSFLDPLSLRMIPPFFRWFRLAESDLPIPLSSSLGGSAWTFFFPMNLFFHFLFGVPGVRLGAATVAIFVEIQWNWPVEKRKCYKIPMSICFRFKTSLSRVLSEYQ